MRNLSKSILIVLSFMALAGCAVTNPETMDVETIQLAMGFRPDIQFAPMYMADSEGYASNEGLDLEFIHIPETEAVELVAADELQFAIVSGEQVLLARSQGMPVVYVMSWWQDYPVAIAAPAGAGLDTISDLEGRRIGIPGLFGASYIGLRAILAEAGIPEEAVQLDSIGYTQVEALLQGLEDAVVIYANNEPLQFERLGMPVNVLRVADYVQLTSNGLITNEKTLQEDPDLVRRMVKALVGALDATVSDPELAFDVSREYVEGITNENEELQRQVLEESIPFWIADITGRSDPTAWENMQTVLLEMGLIDSPMALEGAYTNDYLP
jgi:NitT/TauT family transport system substrate-binding protein